MGIMKLKKRREVYKIYYNIGIREIEGGKEDTKTEMLRATERDGE